MSGIIQMYHCVWLLDQLSPQTLNFNIKIDVFQIQTSQSKLMVLYTDHVKSHMLCAVLSHFGCDPVDCSLTVSSVHGILQARILEWVACPLLGDLPNSRIEPVSLMSPALAGGFFTASATWEAHEGEHESRSVVSDSLQPHELYSLWNSPGQNTGVDSLSLLQGIFPTQGSNPSLPYCRQILYQLSHKGSPRILEWVAYPFSSGSSQTRNRTGVSCIAEAHMKSLKKYTITKVIRMGWSLGRSLCFSLEFPMRFYCAVRVRLACLSVNSFKYGNLYKWSGSNILVARAINSICSQKQAASILYQKAVITTLLDWSGNTTSKSTILWFWNYTHQCLEVF